MGGIYLVTNDYYNGILLPRPLTPAETEYHFELFKSGDFNAYHILIEHNLKLVIYIVRQYARRKEEFADLISVGNIGLIKAVRTFDIDKNIKFATYAGRCIINQILLYLKKVKPVISLDQQICIEGQNESLALIDILYDSTESIEALYERKETYTEICESLEALTELERQVIMKIEGIGCPKMVQREVAYEMGVSRSYISRIATKARLKMVKYITNKYGDTNMYVKTKNKSNLKY